LWCYNNQLMALNVSSNIAALRLLECHDNQLTATALNAVFAALHNNTITGSKFIYIYSNPGSTTCDRSIAENKGWIVF